MPLLHAMHDARNCIACQDTPSDVSKDLVPKPMTDATRPRLMIVIIIIVIIFYGQVFCYY